MPKNLHTYGKYKVSVSFYDVMQKEENAFFSKKVGDYFEKYMTGIKNISKIKDVKFKNSIGKIWYHEHIESVQSSNLPDIIKSYLRNIYHAFYNDKILKIKKNN